MNSSHSNSGPRRHRRGGRTRSSSSRPRSGDNFKVTREPRKPAGLWDKIKAFLGLAPEPAKPSANGHERRERPRDEAREDRAREDRPSRAPREARPPRESRKPEMIEVTTPRLYIGNLSYDAAESDLSELFSG
ncbi:MAG: hypothetical protein WEC73_01325, partial [Chthoniobacterales bacterium]